MVTQAQAAGIAGLVVDGAVRDTGGPELASDPDLCRRTQSGRSDQRASPVACRSDLRRRRAGESGRSGRR
jgi:hypothetical protein